LISNSKQLEVLVAVNDFGKVVGYLSSSTTPYGVAYIQAIAVHPKLQSKGIGKKLLNEKLQRLRKRKTRKVWLLVTNTNPGAVKFYLKMDFFVEGYLRDHTGPGLDEILLSRFL
jgi:ribosomal protein S18 acetylase RimI-like enzyme